MRMTACFHVVAGQASRYRPSGEKPGGALIGLAARLAAER
jgi:hypothetical protein